MTKVCSCCAFWTRRPLSRLRAIYFPKARFGPPTDALSQFQSNVGPIQGRDKWRVPL
jgi:hypothetical protein